ncbi:hypothetical protein ANANG_G00264860 [Anguilla anguilla]|uniref:Uncharacterized protein n=1 Tax=Anguilla anguilla TaxID=7936 RepID=A0A9D3RLF4_ANGAN|nr:hypothetical protein ANANG_G00264860 [Anguilla anguilla]
MTHLHCAHTHTHTCTHTHTYIHTLTHARTRTHACTHTHTYTHTEVYCALDVFIPASCTCTPCFVKPYQRRVLLPLLDRCKRAAEKCVLSNGNPVTGVMQSFKLYRKCPILCMHYIITRVCVSGLFRFLTRF